MPRRTTTISRYYCLWSTEAFNNSLQFYGRRYSKILRCWFSLGVIFGFLALVLATMILLWNFIQLLTSYSKENVALSRSDPEGPIITIVVPGLSIPWSHFGYIAVGTLFAVAFHELGHALSAASEGVSIENVAVFVACLFPGALVTLDHVSLHLLSHLHALRIYSAGVWHNIVCCAGCYIILLLLPTIMYPFYHNNTRPVVLGVSQSSPLMKHLHYGDVILKVHGLQIETPEDWMVRLESLRDQVTPSDGYNSTVTGYIGQGYCLPQKIFQNQKPKEFNSVCSTAELVFFQTGGCSMGNHPSLEAVEKVGISNSNVTIFKHAYCLRATEVVGYPRCTYQQIKGSLSNDCLCEKNDVCMMPDLKSGEAIVEVTYIINKDDCILEVLGGSILTPPPISKTEGCQKSLVFVGDPLALALSVSLRNYVPRDIGLLGKFHVSAPLWLPIFIERLLSYTFYISSAIAFLNSAPVYTLDGEAMLQAWLSLCTSFVHPRTRRHILNISLKLGSFFLVSAFLSAVLKQF